MMRIEKMSGRSGRIFRTSAFIGTHSNSLHSMERGSPESGERRRIVDCEDFPKMNVIRCSQDRSASSCECFSGCCSLCPAGPQGEAATIQIGTVTTGAPGTEAEVTNSGTEQNAILNFVIPRGEPGSGGAPEFLTAYSTPPQPGNSGQALIFDRNGASNGTAVTHAVNTADIVIQQPGYYSVSFHGMVSPAGSPEFPLAILLYLEQNGSSVAGTGVRHIFQTTAETSNLSFTQIIEVDTVPTTLNIVAQGGSILYSDASITVNKIGSIE